MDTDQLRYFCAIVESGSLTKAAELLSLSHGGLSKSMKHLQASLPIVLFQPLGRGLEVTPEGKAFYERTKAVLQQIKALVEMKPVPQNQKIGLTESLAITISGSIAEELGTSIGIFEMDSGELDHAVLSGQLDFGVTFVPYPQDGLEYLRITDFQLGAFTANKSFTLLPIDKIPFSVPLVEHLENPLSIRSRDGWPSSKVQRNEKYQVASLSIALDLVQAGLCAVYMPKFVAKAYHHKLKSPLLELKLSPNLIVKRSLFLVKRKNLQETLSMKKVSKILRTLEPRK
jgi:DNA-binding transcriptional LysR family regulator